MMITPTLEEVELAAAKIGLPQTEAFKFFHYNEARGWRINGRKMVSFPSALQFWKSIWKERQSPQSANGKKHWTVLEIEAETRRIEKEQEEENRR